MHELRWSRGADDMHHHLRDGIALKTTVPFAAKQFRRCIVMPNLKPPVTTLDMALAYRDRILAQVPSNCSFEPLMTLYMTDTTTPEEIRRSYSSGKVSAVKYYPAGATTNSDSGVTDIRNIDAVLQAMSEIGMPLLVHGEVTNRDVDLFDREAKFITDVLQPLIARHPNLKVVMEHITTAQAVDFVLNASSNIAATITPQHLLFNRNAIFEGGLRPHKYCLPVLKRETHRLRLIEAIQSGSPKFFMGTDSAPHVSHKKESSCGCAGIFSAHAALECYATAFEQAGCLNHLEAFCTTRGANFYGINPNEASEMILEKQTWTVPDSYQFEDGVLVPLFASEPLSWILKE